MGLYTISFMLLAWPLYYLIPEILFPVFDCISFRVVSLLGVNVELLSLIFLGASLAVGLSASYMLMKNSQAKNTTLKRGAQILFSTYAIGLFFMFVPVIVLRICILVSFDYIRLSSLGGHYSARRGSFPNWQRVPQ